MPHGNRDIAKYASIGGHAKAEAMRKRREPLRPYPGSILDAMDEAEMVGPSWEPWRVFWKAVYALPMTEADLETFRRHTGRETPPSAPVGEAYVVAGRRSGKSRNAALAAFCAAISHDYRAILAPGEQAVIPVIAADRRQARQTLGYLKGLTQRPAFAPYLGRALRESIELKTGATLEVRAASYRTTRGYSSPMIVADELSYWATDDDAANPDVEVLNALRPTQAAFKGALLVGVSTPYRKTGVLYQAYEKAFGKDDPRTLVWVSDTRSMNALIDEAVIAEAFERDESWAMSEYGLSGSIQFRADLESFLSPEAVASVIVSGRFEVPPVASRAYVAFTDPAGGSGGDSFTLSVAHSVGQRAVLDAVREVRPKFSPEQVVSEFAALLRSYGLHEVTGDRYAGDWPAETFRRAGITYRPSEATKSELYLAVLPLLNAGQVELLDLPRLRRQLLGLERRTAWGGRQSVDHAPGGHDDVGNAVAGALVLAAGRQSRRWTWSKVALTGSGAVLTPMQGRPPWGMPTSGLELRDPCSTSVDPIHGPEPPDRPTYEQVMAESRRIETVEVWLKAKGRAAIINVSDFDETLHEKLAPGVKLERQ